MARDARMRGRGRRFFTHLAWAGPLSQGAMPGQSGRLGAARPPARVWPPGSHPMQGHRPKNHPPLTTGAWPGNHSPERQKKMVSRETMQWPPGHISAGQRCGERRRKPMGSEWDGQQVNAEEHAGNPAIAIPDDGFLSYYRDDMENAGGLKVKW